MSKTVFPNRYQEGGVKGSLVTGQEVNERTYLDVLGPVALQSVGTDTVDSVSTDTTALPVLTIGAHSFEVGQLAVFTSGALNKREFQIVAATSTTITLGAIPKINGVVTFPAAADTLTVYRHTNVRLNASGALDVVTAGGTPVDDGEAIDTNTEGTLVFGASAIPGFARALLVDASSNLKVNVNVALPAGTNNIGDVDVLSSALPTGASTLAEQQTQTTALAAVNASLDAIEATVDTIGTAVPAVGLMVAGSDGTNSRLLKTDTSGELQVDVLTSALPSGAATSANQSTIITSVQLLDDVVATTGSAITTKGNAVAGTDGTNARILKTDTSGELQIDVVSQVEPKSATGTVTSVNDAASSTTLLASNASRLGATFYNTSTQNLYLKCGATASTSSFTVILAPNDFYELPFRYTGIVDGIWAADASGACVITEFT